MTKRMERYRSGHNEAVLKTVCPQGRVGSNPTLSASEGLCICEALFCQVTRNERKESAVLRKDCQVLSSSYNRIIPFCVYFRVG